MLRRNAVRWMVPCMAACLCALTAGRAPAQSISVRTAVEKQDVSVGESFLYQIQVQGADAAEVKDLSPLQDFIVQDLGGQQNNSQSITVVNGRTSQVVNRAYVMTYRLTPKQAGRLTIPPLAVTVAGQQFQTQPVPIRVSVPQEAPDLKLRVALSSERCYVGEPVVLTVTWYIGKDVRNFAYAVPMLEDGRFTIDDVQETPDPGKNYYRVPVGSIEAIAEKGQAQFEGQTYATLMFKKVLIPREPGRFDFPQSTVSAEVLTGYQQNGRGGVFDNFFSDDFFNLGRQGVYKTFVASSNPLSLEVLPVPEAGRPADFSGLIGQYGVQTAASPTEVNVGDPITLTVRVKGSAYLSHFELPPLQQNPELAKRFKIPTEMASGKFEGDEKVFTQTLRALDESVTEVPPIALSYFDSGSGQYRVAQSKAIPLTVRPTKVVTMDDVEGQELPSVRNKLTAWQEGIAYNYEDPSVLENHAYGPGLWMRSPLWLGALFTPPLLFVLLAAGTVTLRRQRANPEMRKARKAHGALASAIRELQRDAGVKGGAVYGELLEALRAYLGKKLKLPAGALTYRDVEGVLSARGVARESLEELRALFEECEAHRYAGGAGSDAGAADMLERALRLAATIERGLGK